MARSSNWFVVVSAVIGLVVIYFIYTLSSSSEYTEFGKPYALKDATTLQHRCVWQEGDPVIYHLRTKLGVNYDAGHWFHMAENFMVQRSILRQAKLLTNASHVLYSFDKEGFIKDLNGITRLMVYQGTHCSLTSPQKLYYLHMTALPWEQARARVGSSVVIDRHTIDELQVADLSGPVSVPVSNASQQSQNRVGVFGGALTSRRFSMVAKYSRWPSHELQGRHDSHTNTGSAGAGAESSGGNKETSSLRRTLAIAPEAVTAAGSVTHLGLGAAPSSHAVRHNSHTQICARYMGTIGGDWPTVQRGHWFPNAGDIDSFRDSLRRACPRDPSTLEATAKKKPYKMVIYQRDLSRKLANEAEALAQLQSSLGSDWEIEVLMHSGSRSPCILAHHLSDADILVTPHGFQSMLLLFLPRPALIFEIFPYRYYKRGYGPFGAEYGVTHGGVMSPPTTWQTSLVLPFVTTATCMGSKFCRNFARSQDVILPPHGVSRLVAFVAENKAQLAQQPSAPRTLEGRDFLY